MASDQLAAALEEIRVRNARVTMAAPLTATASASAEDVPRLLAAVSAVLERHALTALHRHTEPCDRHRYRGIAERGACPDCRVVEWTGCETCRDEYGNPARPEDCKERAVILAALTGEGEQR